MRDKTDDVNMTPMQLREWMGKHGYNTEALADKLGLTKQAVSYWLEGKRVIPEPMGRLLLFFDVKPELLRYY